MVFAGPPQSLDLVIVLEDCVRVINEELGCRNWYTNISYKNFSMIIPTRMVCSRWCFVNSEVSNLVCLYPCFFKVTVKLRAVDIGCLFCSVHGAFKIPMCGSAFVRAIEPSRFPHVKSVFLLIFSRWYALVM